MSNFKPKQRPSHDAFLDKLLEVARLYVQMDIDTATPWLSLGDERTRSMILALFKDAIESEHQVELVVEQDLVNLNRPLESIALQLHHVFSNVHLMERINAKIRARLN